MPNITRWAALLRDGTICNVGVQLTCRRFNKAVFVFSCGGYAQWVAHGARYCKINDAQTGNDIADVHHGQIRKCKDVPRC